MIWQPQKKTCLNRKVLLPMVQNLGWFKKIIICKNLKTNDLITIIRVIKHNCPSRNCSCPLIGRVFRIINRKTSSYFESAQLSFFCFSIRLFLAPYKTCDAMMRTRKLRVPIVHQPISRGFKNKSLVLLSIISQLVFRQ